MFPVWCIFFLFSAAIVFPQTDGWYTEGDFAPAKRIRVVVTNTLDMERRDCPVVITRSQSPVASTYEADVFVVDPTLPSQPEPTLEQKKATGSGISLKETNGHHIAYQLDDLDQDGFVLEDDCNDNDATISPEGIEQIDGIDQNCNEADGDNLTFTLVVYSEGPSLFVGHDPRLANLSPIWHFGFTDGISTDWMCADPTQDSVCLNLYRRGNNEYTGVIPTVDLYTFILWAEDQCYVGGYSPSLYAGLGCNLLPNP